MKTGGREDMSVVVGLITRSRIQSLTALESDYNKSPGEYAWRRKQGADAHNKIHKKKTTKT